MSDSRSAYAGESRWALVQTTVAAQSNAITTIPDVLTLLDLAGATITLDVIGCQKELVRHIRLQQADSVLTVKENQPTLRTALEETFSVERAAQFEGCPHTAHRTVNGGHGRIEIRRGWALGDPEYLQDVDPEGHGLDLRSLRLVEAVSRDQVSWQTEPLSRHGRFRLPLFLWPPRGPSVGHRRGARTGTGPSFPAVRSVSTGVRVSARGQSARW